MSNHRKTVTAALLAGAAALGVAACGDDGDQAGSDRPSAQEMRAAAVKFARCMREHGVEMADPKVGEDGGLEISIQGRPGSQPNLEAAQKACQKYLPKGGEKPSQEDQAEMRKQALAFARCMREHGVDMPDPQFGDGTVKMGGPGSGVNPNSPTFRAAEEKCSKDAPGGGRMRLQSGPGGGGE